MLVFIPGEPIEKNQMSLKLHSKQRCLKELFVLFVAESQSGWS